MPRSPRQHLEGNKLFGEPPLGTAESGPVHSGSTLLNCKVSTVFSAALNNHHSRQKLVVRASARKHYAKKVVVGAMQISTAGKP